MQSGVTIRPWQSADFDRLGRSAALLSRETVASRFHGGVPVLPASYLRSVRKRWPFSWDAVVAVNGDRLLGWAEYGIVPGAPGFADVAACVIDAEQGHGLGRLLLAAVVERARSAGLMQVHVDIAYENGAARHAWIAATGSARPTLRLAPLVAA